MDRAIETRIFHLRVHREEERNERKKITGFVIRVDGQDEASEGSSVRVDREIRGSIILLFGVH